MSTEAARGRVEFKAGHIKDPHRITGLRVETLQVLLRFSVPGKQSPRSVRAFWSNPSRLVFAANVPADWTVLNGEMRSPNGRTAELTDIRRLLNETQQSEAVEAGYALHAPTADYQERMHWQCGCGHADRVKHGEPCFGDPSVRIRRREPCRRCQGVMALVRGPAPVGAQDGAAPRQGNESENG